jgi:hypothetical protein
LTPQKEKRRTTLKGKRAITLALLLLMTPVLRGICSAASVDGAAPYEGQYVLAYTPVSSGSSLTTGALSGFETNAILSENYISAGSAPIAVEPEFDAIDPAALTAQKNDMQMSVMTSTLALGDTYTFKAETTHDKPVVPYNVTAKLLAEGTSCTIFVETAYAGESDPLKISYAQAGAIAAEFDRARGIMQTAIGPNLTNNDGKIVILLHNIKETDAGGYLPFYIAGYFTPGDYLYGQADGGNSLAMLHIDIPVLLMNDASTAYEIDRGYSTMVHEFQHLINWTDTLNTYYETSIYKENEMWMNEMMSMAAEHMMYVPLEDRIWEYNTSAMVRRGAVLTYANYDVNDGVPDVYEGELGANYGLPYLFGQYLRVQTEGLTGAGGAVGGDGIFKLILDSDYADYRAVTEALGKLSYGVTDFDSLHANFKLATFLNELTGYYGYCGDMAFRDVHAPVYTTGSSLTLKAGAAVIVAQPEGEFTPEAGATASFLAFTPEEGIFIADDDGNSVPALENNMVLDIAANVTAVSGGTVPVLVAGLYTPEGKMVRLWGFTGSAGIGRTMSSLTLPGDAAGCRLKVFYMAGSLGRAPLCAMYQIG